MAILQIIAGRFEEDYVPEEHDVAAAGTSSYNVNKKWYSDIGTTNHIIGELEKLVVHDQQGFKPRATRAIALVVDPFSPHEYTVAQRGLAPASPSAH